MFPKTLDVETFPYLKGFSFSLLLFNTKLHKGDLGADLHTLNYSAVSMFKLL
jgi:hypothetical protein